MTMKKPIFNYDEISDTLYVSFEPGEKATGIELNEHILLRINIENWTIADDLLNGRNVPRSLH